MPTLKRLSLPGQVYHVFTRAAEGRVLYRTERDIVDLLGRIDAAVTATRVSVYGWVLTPGRLHFLLRNGRQPLTLFVSRIVSGYAISQNRRQGTSGSLFAGRYRSVLVEEERYFLKVLAYIHRLPLQEGTVSSSEALDGYRWSGHAALLNRKSFPWQDTGYVLRKFSGAPLQARVLYSRFIHEADSSAGTDLDGGGLLRSASLEGLGVAREGVSGHDPRTLGSARFTREQLRSLEEMEDWDRRVRADKEEALEVVVEQVRNRYGLSRRMLLSRSKRPQVSDARALICYLGCMVIGLPYGTVGGALGISASGAYMAAGRGKTLVTEKPELVEELELPIV